MKIKSGFFIFLNLFFLLFFACLPADGALAAVAINEIMYDLEGNDADREWVEILNNLSAEIDLTGWKFNDGSNHLLNAPPKNGGQGSLVVPAGDYAVFAADASIFLSEHSGYSGTVIDTVMALNNTSAVLKLVDDSGSEVFFVSYDKSTGAAGDGDSLQYITGTWAAALPTPGAENNVPSDPPPQQSQGSSAMIETNASSPGSSYTQPEDLPRIKAEAGANKIAAAGASIEFRGMAFGFDDKPIDNARYLWNFGDGATKEGQNVFYSYRYPGEYSVFLDVSSGGYSASDRLVIKIITPEITISEVKPGENSFIEIYNNSKEELNISGWQVSSGIQSFFFPKGSYIRPQSYLVISNSTSGINLSAGKGLVQLSYVGDSTADAFNYEGILTEGQSFSRQDKKSVITKETPGSANVLTVSTGAIVKKEIVSAAAKENKISDDKDKEIVLGAVVPPEESSPANVFSATKENSGFSGTKFYFFVVLGLAILAGAGVLLIRRQRGG